jgi:hypothetical protein
LHFTKTFVIKLTNLSANQGKDHEPDHSFVVVEHFEYFFEAVDSFDWD